MKVKLLTNLYEIIFTQIARDTYEQVLQCLEKHFADKVKVVSERYSFDYGVRKVGESIDELVALRRLAQRYNFGAFLDTSARSINQRS